MGVGKKYEVEYGRAESDFKADLYFLKITVCADVIWEYYGGSVTRKGQECTVKKKIFVPRSSYKVRCQGGVVTSTGSCTQASVDATSSYWWGASLPYKDLQYGCETCGPSAYVWSEIEN